MALAWWLRWLRLLLWVAEFVSREGTRWSVFVYTPRMSEVTYC